MDSALLVPATAALLEGWCGPVVLLDAHGGPALAGAHLYRDGRVSVFADWTAAAFDATTVCSLHGEIDRVALDLSRAECRARVALLLAPVMGLGRVDSACGMPGRTWYLSHGLAWAEAHEGSGWRRYPDSCEGVLASIPVEGDDTRLPDGSRRVDALALAAVAREVLRCAP